MKSLKLKGVLIVLVLSIFILPRIITKVKFIVVLLMFVLCGCCLPEVETKDTGLDVQKDWRVGVAAWSFNKFTFFEAIDKTASLGLGFIESFDSQRISKDIPEKMGQNLSDEILAKIKGKLDSARVKLTSHYFFELPSDERRCRQAFEFGRKLGMETFVCEPELQALDTIEKLCNEYGINLAIHNHPKGRSRYWHPREVLKVCQGRSKRIGACGDTGHWVRSGINPVEAVKMLQDRLISFHIKDLNKFGDPNAHDVPWGSGKGQIEPLLTELHRQGVKPTLFGIEYEHHMENSLPEIAECVRFFNRITAELAGPPAKTMTKIEN